MLTVAAPARSLAWRLAWLYFGAVMLAYCVIILTAKLPPGSVDYPMWAYEGILFHGVITGHPVAGYVMKHYPVPQSMTMVVVGLLNTLVLWNLAAKLWVCIYLALGGVASWMLASAMRIRSALLVVTLPPILFVNIDFWWGHISFEVGMCLVMILIAMALRGTRSSVLSVILLAIFFTHMEACACALLFLGLWMMYTSQWRRAWLAAPTLLLSLWYAVARYAGGNADAASVPEPAHPYGSGAFFVYKASSYFKIFGYVNATNADGFSQSETIFGRHFFVVLIVLSLCIGALCLIGLIRAAMVRGRSDYKYMRAMVLFLLVSAAFVPQIFLGSSDPGSRLVLMAAAVGFFLVDWRGPIGRSIAALSVVFCLANLWQFARIEQTPTLMGHAKDLPAPLLLYGHVDAATALVYYVHLGRGEMNQAISTTALFLPKAK